jgi:hypothetical protein
MAEQERVVVVDAALPVGQVGMAHPAGRHIHNHLSGTGIGDDDVDQLDRLALLP